MIPDAKGEKWNGLELKVQQMFSNNLELDWAKIEMKHVHDWPAPGGAKAKKDQGESAAFKTQTSSLLSKN